MNRPVADKHVAELPATTIAEAARLIEKREISCVELTQAFLRRIETFDAQLSSFITLTAELALRQAAHADNEIAAGRYRGPLHGIPVGLKDIYYTEGILTTGHSKTAIDHVPRFDSTAAAKLTGAGTVLLGKLATHEFAHGGPSFDLPWPPARNPWNTAHFTGGSSSGSGAAVAARLTLGALGTDTGGSIRGPASFCGIVGVKPTYGLVSRYGVIPNAFSFDHCGPLTATVEDAAIVLQAIAGYDPADPASANVRVPDLRAALSADLKGLRIGVLRHLWEEDIPADDELRAAMEGALDVLRRLGATLEDARIHPAQEYYDCKVVISESEALAIQQKALSERPQDFGEHYVSRVCVAALWQAVDYVRAQRQRMKLVMDMKPLYEKYDLFVTIGHGPAPRLDAHKSIGFWDKWQKPSITTPFNVTAGPVVMLPNGFSRSGLPLGMQFVGRPFDEQTVLKAAYAYEQATEWHKRLPPLAAGAPPAALDLEPHSATGPKIDPALRSLVEMLAQRAGLTRIPEPMLLQLCEAAPYALAMAQRLPGAEWEAEPANIFRFPDGLPTGPRQGSVNP